jgi:hypothetical protein
MMATATVAHGTYLVQALFRQDRHIFASEELCRLVVCIRTGSYVLAAFLDGG